MQSVLYGVGYPLSADGADRAGLGHGLVLGLVNLIWGVGAVVGPVAGAAVADALGDRAAYAMLVALSFAMGAAVARVSSGSAPAATL
jgi:MFS family permease